jgi:hypothetical protein
VPGRIKKDNNKNNLMAEYITLDGEATHTGYASESSGIRKKREILGFNKVWNRSELGWFLVIEERRIPGVLLGN